MSVDKAAMGVMCTRKSLKVSPDRLAMMMLGGSPIKVAAPPIFDAKTSAIRNGTGETPSRSVQGLPARLSQVADRVVRKPEHVSQHARLLDPHGDRWMKKHLDRASVLAVVAPLASPVAGLFLGVAGGALFLSGRRRAGVALAVTALVPTVAVALAFGNGGYQTFAAKQALIGFLVCLAVAALCWRLRVVRWGALLSAVPSAGSPYASSMVRSRVLWQGVVVDLLGVGPGRKWSPMMIVGIGLTVPPAFSSKVTISQLLW
jgi:hypothetical protein